MHAQQQTPATAGKSVPVWYTYFAQEVIELRNLTHCDDINRKDVRVSGYVAALLMTNTITFDQSELFYALIDNAAEYATKDITARQRAIEQRMVQAVQNKKEVSHVA